MFARFQTKISSTYKDDFFVQKQFLVRAFFDTSVRSCLGRLKNTRNVCEFTEQI